MLPLLVAPFQVKIDMKIIEQKLHFCLYGITNEIMDWLGGNSSSHHTLPPEILDDYVGVVWIYFDDDADFIAFKLRWI